MSVLDSSADAGRVLPGPEPVPPMPDPDPGPESPRPEPIPVPDPEPAPDPGRGELRPHSDVVVELRGSVAVLSGVVESADERAEIAARVESLDGITRVDSRLRPPAA